MDKFCANCGSPLEEGSICSCQQQTTQDQEQNIPEQQQNTQQQQYVQIMAPAPPNAFVIYLKKMWTLIIALVKAPAKVGTQFVGSADYKLALGLIGAQSLAVVFLFLSFAGKFNSAIVAVNNLDTSKAYGTGTSTVRVSLGGGLSDIKFSMFTVLVVVGIITFALACLMAGVIMLIIKIFKGNTDYKHLLCVSAINSIMSTPFLLAAFFVSLLMPMDIAKSISSGNVPSIYSTFIFPLLYPLLIALVGNIIGWFTSLKVIAGGSDIDDNKAIYVLFLSAIVMIIATYLTIKVGGPMCLPSTIREGLSKLN